ncbi:hypothetical protein CONLIGDRAFT_637028 [Coniochaeta ligniaria NRRL 30616]|uniref:Uncharacterized protein n=1 Tax=Coniochaeta ligniaria NRRL 30616 TaxID=1408157 RepID=A0A1J7I8J4_9PEZI|nr:hypothetical protein CONLIGDRAFT_637028 [Coniochaeta ligniaria NRRL 30616]
MRNPTTGVFGLVLGHFSNVLPVGLEIEPIHVNSAHHSANGFQCALWEEEDSATEYTVELDMVVASSRHQDTQKTCQSFFTQELQPWTERNKPCHGQ